MHIIMPTRAAHVVLGLAVSLVMFGQGPISDRLVVTLPNTTWVGSQSLPPGEYTIRQLPTASNPRLLEFSSSDGTKLEAAVTAIAAIDNNNRRDTSVVLKQQGGQYHLTHVWIEGKTYGYELPVDTSKQMAAAKSEAITLAATFAPAPQEIAANQPPAPVTPVQTPEPASAAAPEKSVEQAAAQPAPQAPAQPEPAPAPQAPAQPEPAQPQPTQAENAQVAAQTPEMPKTAGHWADLLLLGFGLITLGLFLMPRRLPNA